jgi:protein-arginine kinase activator protein McsA
MFIFDNFNEMINRIFNHNNLIDIPLPEEVKYEKVETQSNGYKVITQTWKGTNYCKTTVHKEKIETDREYFLNLQKELSEAVRTQNFEKCAEIKKEIDEIRKSAEEDKS